jgi:enterochelin esterase-like enzyme
VNDLVPTTATTPRVRGDLAIAALVNTESTDAAAVDRFVEAHGFPIVEGRYCTFVFRGDVHEVRLRHWVFGLPTSQPFTRLAGTDLWYYVIELPEGSRVEYKLELRRGAETRLVQDPLNPRIAHDPFGANSVCHAEGYEVPEWTSPDPDAPTGRLEDRLIHSEALGGRRQVTLYYPARFRRTRRYPLVIFHDGGDYARYSSLKTVLDNLIHRLEIPGLIAALTHPPDRMAQYRGSRAHSRYLTEELVPLLESELPLIARPEARGLVGASLGAVAALSTAADYSGFYGRLLLQSGSFAFSDIGHHDRGPVFDPIVDFVNGFRDHPRAVSKKVFVTCGMHESLIYENRTMVPLLQSTGMDVRYVEARDGHNWENWRDRLRTGLSWLFPGPLWLVYD